MYDVNIIIQDSFFHNINLSKQPTPVLELSSFGMQPHLSVGAVGFDRPNSCMKNR